MKLTPHSPPSLALLVFAMLLSPANAQVPTIAGIANSGDFSSRLCPGISATIFGSNFGSGPTASVTVLVGGNRAYVSLVLPTQITVQIPFESPIGPATVTVATGGSTSSPFSIALTSVAPAFFSANSSGTSAIVALLSNFAPASYGAPAQTNETVGIFVTGLGVTNPPTATGIPPATTTPPRAAVTPTVTIGGVTANLLGAFLNPGTPGIFLVNLTVPAGVQGTQPLVLTSGTTRTTQSVTIPLAGISRLVSNGGFGFERFAAPGQIASVFANGLGQLDQLAVFPATISQGVQVRFNNTPAPIFHLVGSGATKTPPTEQQIDLLVPQELVPDTLTSVALTTTAGSTANYSLAIVRALPGLYRLQDPSRLTRFNIIAQFANTAWLALSVCGRPATPGDYLIVYLTGLGITTPGGDPNGRPLATGAVPPPDGSVLYQVPSNLPITVKIGGIDTPVLYAGLAPGFPGLYQVNVQVPAGVANGDDISVVVAAAGNSDSATLSIQPRSP